MARESHNVLCVMWNRELGGSSKARFHGSKIKWLQILADFWEEQDDRLKFKSVPQAIQELEEYASTPAFDDTRCLELLKSLQNKLTNFESRRINEESEKEHNDWAKLFIEFNGVQILLRLLMFTYNLPPKQYERYETERLLRVKSVILDILSLIVTTKVGETVARELAQKDDVLVYLFQLLAFDKTYLTSAQLLEDILQERSGVFDLSRIEGLRQLMMAMEDEKLANLCRIFAVTVSDLDVYENKSSLFEQNRQRRSKGFINNRDKNQELLMGYTELLERLVNIACSQPYVPRTGVLPSELECWMDYIENSIAEEIFDPPAGDDLETFIGGVSYQQQEAGSMVQQPSLKVSYSLLHKVDVVYVLGLFLVGKHRKKVQRRLAELKLIPGMSDLFDKFIWKCQSATNQRHRLRGHNSSCECSPEVAMKIQFLRLVHSFCDHSEYKHLLLTKSELEEIKQINIRLGREKQEAVQFMMHPRDKIIKKKPDPLAVDCLDGVNRSLMSRGRQGLLTKIVEVMKKEPAASTFRFWLARAVESYLRGTTLYCDQIFLIRRGLLKHVADNILEHENRPKEILQSSFDLLGELVKFNYDAFRTFDEVLDADDRFRSFIEIIGKNLVDSNMFLRSLVLTYEHFNSTQTEHKEYVHGECKLLTHVGAFQNQLEYLHKLIAGINVLTLTQENVSCLNTTLVFLMFANRKEQLAKYLKALRDRPQGPGSLDRHGNPQPAASGTEMMKNFRDLLLFWQDHYLHKDKDCSALEKSSRISFEFWKETVATLVSKDPTSCQALIFYMPEGAFPRTC